MRMKLVSPRRTQWYQMLDFAPMVTSPMTAAVGAIQASAWMLRELAFEGVERSVGAWRVLPYSAAAGSRVSTAMPSISPMFCTAAPEAPLPRLS